MHKYCVTCQKRGSARSAWAVEKDGVEVDVAPRKSEAKRVARKAAKGMVNDYGEVAKLVVEREDGSVQESFTYGDNGNDSEPSQPWMP